MEAGDQAPEQMAVVQESIGVSHSPQASVRAHQENGEPQVGEAPGERRYDKLRKMGAVDFQDTTDPMKAEHWLRET